MQLAWNDRNNSAIGELPHAAIIARCAAGAELGEGVAYFDLGVAFSTPTNGVACDLVEAHKWFNLASVAGHEEAATFRADIAEDLTTAEIAEAQRRARQWLRTAPAAAA